MKKILFTLIAFITLQPLAAMKQNSSLNLNPLLNEQDKQKRQRELNEALWSAAQAGRYTQIPVLIAHGAQVNYRSLRHAPPLAQAIHKNFAKTCSVLLEYGANIQQNNPLWSTFNFISYSKEATYTTILTESVIRPNENLIKNSIRKIQTILGCLKKKGLPKDVQKIIILHLPDHDIGNIMILRKLHGKLIPPMFIQATEEALYDSTSKQIKLLIEKLAASDDYMDVRIKTLSYKSFESKIQANIKRRLQMNPLFCNGVYENQEGSCTIF